MTLGEWLSVVHVLLWACTVLLTGMAGLLTVIAYFLKQLHGEFRDLKKEVGKKADRDEVFKLHELLGRNSLGAQVAAVAASTYDRAAHDR